MPRPLRALRAHLPRCAGGKAVLAARAAHSPWFDTLTMRVPGMP